MITVTNRAINNAATNAITSSSVAFANNTLYILTLWADCGSGDTVTSFSTPSGGGITWTSLRSTTGAQRYYCQVWTGYVASGATTGTVTSTTTTVGGNVIRTFCCIDEVTGTTATAASNGASAIVQSAVDSPASSTSSTVTLSAFADATNNVTYGVFGTGTNQSIVAESGGGYTLGATTNGTGGGFGREYKIGQDTSVNATAGVAAAWRSIAMEIAALGVGTSVGMVPI